ncbi:MAG TPA: SBBP repeat-containing protein, partial [Myxococcaceae bacterium]|nr:SBBP repeat-containing protein [Myxococcaceae bacterium]
DGNQLWLARYNGPENSEDFPSAIAVDAAGNAHVTGTSVRPDLSAQQYATVKYDLDGNELWVTPYNGPRNHDAASAIALDAAGNVYVTGVSEGAGTSLDYATLKYDPDGNQLWVARYDDPDHGEDLAIAIVLDPAGNVFVTGGSCNGPPDPVKGCASSDFATIKYAQ